MNAAAPRLEASIKRYLAPVLHADGFTGSGRSFRRSNDDFIQVVNVQGSRYGGRFAINLGVHPLHVPDISGNPPDPLKMREEGCAFRRRLTESDSSRGDKWWEHGATAASMDEAMRQAASVYESTGRRVLPALAGKGSPLLTITPAHFDTDQFNFFGFGDTKVRMARALALMRKAAGDLNGSRAFALIGLANLKLATFLRKELEELARQ